MVSNHQIIRLIFFLKVALFASILCASTAFAIESSNYQSNIDASQTENVNQRVKQQKLSSTASCAAYFKETVNANSCRAGEVPLPAASWLFLLALIGFVGLSNKRKI
jgi:hypothetical protein